MKPIHNDPDVTGYQWVLSSRHHITDECTMMNELDSGAGPGVYLKKDCPPQPVHPNCMCMLVPYVDEPPERTTFKTFKDYLEKQSDRDRADMIGKANAQSPVLYRRGLERRGINPDRPGEPRRIPEELVVGRGDVRVGGVTGGDANGKNNNAQGLTNGAENSKLDSEGFGFSRIEGEHTIEADRAAVNPNFKTGAEEYQNNCVYCTAANEMRRRGYDVEAAPSSVPLETIEWVTMFVGFQVLHPSNSTEEGIVEEIEQDALAWGEGARGSVLGVLPGGKKAHAFSLEVAGGSVRFIDSQDDGGAVRHFRNMVPSQIVYGRLDGLNPSDKVKKACVNKGRL